MLMLWSLRHRWLVLAVVTAAALAAVPLALRIRLESDVLRLLPQRGPVIRTFKTYLDHFGSLERLYLVFELRGDDDTDITDAEDFIDAFVAKLRQAPEVQSVDDAVAGAGKDWSYVFDRQLLLLGPAGAREALARFDPIPMRLALQRSRDLLTAPSGDVKSLVQQDPLGLFELMRAQVAGDGTLPAFDPSARGYLSKDRRSRLVMVKPVRPPYDTDFSRRLLGRIGEIEREVRGARGGGDDIATRIRIETGGGYRVAIESEDIIRTEAIGQSAGSMILILLFVFAVFRNLWVLVCGVVPLTLGALFTVAGHAATGDPLSAAATGFTAMLFGLGIDGILLLYLRYLEERETTGTPDEASVAGAIARLAPTTRSMVLGNVTTAATFFALMLLDFPSLEQMGSLVGTSMLLSCALAVLLLPPLFAIGPRPARPRALTTAWLASFVQQQPRAILIGAALATVVLAAGATRLRVATGLEKLQPQTAGSRIEREIIERFGLPADVGILLSEGRDLQTLLAQHHGVATAVRTEGAPVRLSGPATLLPPDAEQEAVARAIRESGLTPAEAARRLREAAQDEGFQPGSFDSFIARLATLLDPAQRLTLEGYHQHGLGDAISRFVVRSGDHLLAVSYAAAARSELAHLQSRSPSVGVTGVTLVDEELRRTFFPQFALGVGLGTLAVTILIYFAFRRLSDTLLALLPTALGLVWSAGLLGYAGVELDLFSFFAVMTFLGIGVDYGIHLLYRCAVESSDARGALGEALTRTGPAILLAGGATIISYATLVGSSYGPLRSLAIMSIVTTITCVAATLLVLPAIVALRSR